MKSLETGYTALREAEPHTGISTLYDVLDLRAREDGDRPAYAFLPDGETESVSLTWSQVERAARSFAVRLQTAGIGGSHGAREARVLIALPPGLDFVVAFLGSLAAGGVAVPCAPPGGRRSRPRFAALTRDAEPAVIVTSRDLTVTLSEGLAEDLPRTAWMTHDILDRDTPARAGEWERPVGNGDAPALLQYTSGSTSSPRGVLLTHAHLIRNLRMIRDAFDQSRESVVVGWLPLFHDMGLIGNVLSPMFTGARCVLMPPAAFLQRPVRWLRAVTRYRATTSGGPDFGYALCAARIAPSERAGLDLSSWRTAFNGSEPVRPETLDRFTEAFRSCGFRRESFLPCYGLAEATLLVSGKQRDEGARVVPDPGIPRRSRAACGPPAEGLEVLVVDPERGTSLPAGRVGEIWVSGPTVALGYWRRPEETRDVFHAERRGGTPDEPRYLRTGDLGFVESGEIVVTGRLKDLIIVRGRNHYPSDIESTVTSVSPHFLPGCGAAFGVEVDGEERLVIAQELDRGGRGVDRGSLTDSIRAAVAEAHEIQPHAVLLLRPGALPRTTSGKVRRNACAAAFLAGTLDPLASDVRPASSRAAARPRAITAAAQGTEAERAARLESYVRDLVEGVLGCALDPPDRDRPLTSLGLDSLAAVSLQHAIERDLGANVPVSALFQGATVGSLARYLAMRPEAEQSDGCVESAPAPPGAPNVAPSQGQRSLWLQRRMAPESGAYHLPFAARLGADTDVDALERTLQRLVRRHASLRSRFTGDGEDLRVRVSEEVLRVARVDAGEWEPGELERWIGAETRRPFDLEREVPFRATLLREREDRHVLVLVIHHIAVDFWSLSILVEELASLYAEERGVGPRIPMPAATYSEFTAWQEALLECPAGGGLMDRWKARLHGAPAAVHLPTDRSRRSGTSFTGERVRFEIDQGITRALRERAAKENATPNMILLACFGALLARLGGQEDLVIGVPAAGRPSARYEDVVGYFANLVPVRLDLSGNPSFSEVARRARDSVLASIELQHVPLSRLVERIQPAREAGRSPLFQVVLAYERAHRLPEIDLGAFATGSAGPPVRIGELDVEPLACDSGGAPFELTMMIVESGARLRASIDYRSDLFERSTIERLATRFTRMLELGLRDPAATRLSDLALLSDEERSMVVEEWNRTEAAYPRERSVHELVREQARTHPEAEAVRDGEGSWSYEELLLRSGGVARALRERGIRGEERVGVLVERSRWMVAALLGVLRSGGAYVPLEESYPEERLRWMVGDCGIRVVVASGSQGARARGWGVEVVEVEGAGACEGPWEEVDGEGLAYVIYTSGSTGTPKGVMVPHRAIVRLLWSEDVRLDRRETVLGFAPVAFDASTFEIWAPMVHGARLALAPPGTNDLDALGRFLAERGVTTAWLTAGLFHLMVEEHLPDLAGVRRLLAGGDVLSAGHVRRALTRLPGLRLVNGYGPTEATTFTCCHRMDDPSRVEDPVPIGRPIAVTRVYVLDRWGTPLPPGAPGEIWIGGDGLARGYEASPAATAARFVPDPFGPPGTRLYRSGDRGRWRPDGTIEFLGRIDDQVKVRGFRVEPGEVESALLRHPDVAGAAVVARRDGTAGAQLIAWVVPRDPAVVPSPESLRGHLRAGLPEHLVPSRCVTVEALPVTVNGKVDRGELARRPLPGLGTGPDAEPETEIERMLAELWREALGVERVGLDENFFDLGAHSLTLAKVHARLADRLGRPVPIVDLFHHTTIRTLAAHLAGGARADDALAGARRRGAARRAVSRTRRVSEAASPEVS